ncbi:hypothetical protein FGB62_50g011 [Gracilaria domingensis]|nr:hypothetical protein FGB62_50g011 [Gracilaria domingensis]
MLNNRSRNEPAGANVSFARLCILLRDGDQTREAVRSAAAAYMTRSQIDTGMNRDSFWSVIENRSNNSTVRTREDFCSDIEGVVSDVVPPVRRSAALLKSTYGRARKSFTYYYDLWSRSGQNDSDAFHRFLPRVDNNRFLSSDARAFIIFRVCRCGTSNSDTELISMCTRVMEEGVACEVGIARDEVEQNLSEPPPKKRRAGDVESLKALDGRLNEVIEVSKASIQASLELAQANEDKVDLTSKLDAQLDLLRKQLQDRRKDEEAHVLQKDKDAWDYLQQMSNFQVSNLMTTIEETKNLMKNTRSGANDGSSA